MYGRDLPPSSVGRNKIFALCLLCSQWQIFPPKHPLFFIPTPKQSFLALEKPCSENKYAGGGLSLIQLYALRSEDEGRRCCSFCRACQALVVCPFAGCWGDPFTRHSLHYRIIKCHLIRQPLQSAKWRLLDHLITKPPPVWIVLWHRLGQPDFLVNHSGLSSPDKGQPEIWILSQSRCLMGWVSHCPFTSRYNL